MLLVTHEYILSFQVVSGRFLLAVGRFRSFRVLVSTRFLYVFRGQKQPPDVFYIKKLFLKIFIEIFIGKHLCGSLFLIKL